MKKQYDVVVIGGGPGGTPAAIQLASQGKSVLLIEDSGKLGGACLFIGCIPSKIIKHFADDILVKREYTGKESWTTEERAQAWGQIKVVMQNVLEKRSMGAMHKVKDIPTLDFVAGTAKFLSSNELIIDTAGNQELCTFDKAIIATGARSFVPPFKGNAVEDVLTSEVFFTQEKLPETLLIVGGGPIGVELAQMLTKLGVKCTIIERAGSILSGVVEAEYASIITKEFERTGIDVYTSSTVQEINKKDGVFTVTFADAGDVKHQLNYENVLVATGKIPNIDYLDVEKMNLASNHKGIEVNEYLETSVKGIYATGDVIDGPKFAHTATYEAHLAAANIMAGNKQPVDFTKNSWVLFSDPEIACAGYTEAEATEGGYHVITGVYDYKVDAAAQVANAPFGYMKYVVNKENMQIIGVSICVGDAASLAGEAALIVANRLTLKDVAQTIHPHPTLSEAFGILAQMMLSKIRH